MHRPRPPRWSALDAARAGTARPMLLGLPAELRCSRPPPLAAESDERSTGTCRARWATPCTDLPFSVVVFAGSSGCSSTDDFQARRATSQRRGDLWSKSAVVYWLVFPPVTQKTRAQFLAAELLALGRTTLSTVLAVTQVDDAHRDWADMSHSCLLVSAWLLAPLDATIGKNRAWRRAQKHRNMTLKT